MIKLVILGGSGIGMIAASIANDLGYYRIMGFLNDVEKAGTLIGNYNKIPVIGTTSDVQSMLDDDVYFFVGYVGMKREEEVFNKILNLNIPRNKFATLIHPRAIIPKGFCEIGNGVLIAPNAQLSPDTNIDDNCIILGNTIIGHNSKLKRFAHVAASGHVGANVVLGKGVHIGSNATLREKISIGDFSIVGSGSVVLNDVPENTIVVGNPARILKKKE